MLKGKLTMDIESAVPFEVSSIQELARWIVSTESQHATLYLLTINNKHILCTLTSMTGYYNYTGLPIVLYCSLDTEPSGPFLRYDIRVDAKSRTSFTEGFDESDSNLGYIQYIPIIKLKKKPSIFNFEL